MSEGLKIKRFNLDAMDLVYDLMQNVVAEGEWYAETSIDIKETFVRWKTGLEQKLPQLVAYYDDELIGWSETSNSGRTNLAISIGVAKEFRGQGVGRALLLNMIKFAELSGFKKLTLNVYDHNDLALKLARNHGFRVKSYTNKRNCMGRELARNLTMFREIGCGNSTEQ